MQVKVLPRCLPRLFSLFSLLAVVCVSGTTFSSVASAAAVNGGLLEIKDVILDFIQRKPITLSTIYYCNHEDKKLVDELMEKRNIRISAIDLRQPRTTMRSDTDLLRIGFIVDMRCNDILPLLDSDQNFFEARQIYLLVVNSFSIDDLLPVLQLQNGVRLDSDITVLSTDGLIYDCYKIDNARNQDALMVIHENGRWNGTRISSDYNPDHYKIIQRTNLMNISLDAVLYLNDKLVQDGHPWTEYLIERLDTTHDTTLYHLRLLHMLQDKYNFSVRLRKTNTWSASTSSDTVSGELGFLHRHQAIFMITPYRMTLDRIDFGDFAAITWEPHFLFLFRHPKSTSIHSKYLVPFQWSVWFAILTTLIMFTLVLSVHLQRSSSFETISDRRLLGVSLWLFGYAFQQYAGHLPKLNSSRVLIVSLIFMSYVSYQYYCTFIIGSLITESPKTIKTLDDLIDSGLQIGTTRAVYTRDLFFSVADSRMAYIYDELIEKRGNRMDVEEAVERIQRGNFAYHHDGEALYGIMNGFNEQEICDLATVSFFRPFPCGMQVTKRSALRELFFMGLQPIMESGVADVERFKYFTPKPRCVKSQVEVVPVAFDTITVPYLVLVSGVIASLIILALEKLLHRLVNKCWEGKILK